MNPRRLFLAAFLAAAAGVALVHGRSAGYGFVYDDVWTIVRNPALRSPFPLSKFLTDPGTAAAPESGIGPTVYRPLPALTFAANFRWAGPRPWAWHLPELLLHALNGALLFFLLAGPLKLSRGAAALGAAVFLFHPAQVESVAWVTQRSNLMCAAGGFGALLLAARGNLWALAAWAAALLSKETAAALAPFLAAAAISSPAGPRRKKQLVLGTAAAGAVYVLWRAAVTEGLAQRPWRGGPLENFLVGQAAWLEHVKLSLWPARLAASHLQRVGNPWEHPAPWLGLSLLALWIVGTVLLWRKVSRRAALAAAWVPATLAPHLGLLPLDTFAAERFLYLPLAGGAALAALAFETFPRGRVLAAVLLALPVLSFRQTGVWRDELTLWRSSARAEPDNPFSRLALADALYARGRLEESAQATREGLALNPSSHLAFAGLNNLSDIALHQGRPGAARAFAEKALRINPRSRQAQDNLRRALSRLK